MSRPNGIILWEGHSPLDGARIVCVATGLASGSANRKTGALVQTFILRADRAPVAAVGDGADASVCGQCPHRPFLGGDCYVQVGQAPQSVWRTYAKGGYLRQGDAGWGEAHAHLMTLPLRAGSYGDPALVPLDVWARLRVVTGYTHQWRAPFAAGHKAYMMASCDGPADLQAARDAGWRTFSVAAHDATEGPEGTILCPSKRGVLCEDCGLCGGLQRPTAKGIWIPAHGPRVRTRSEPAGMERVGPSRLTVLQ